MVASPAASHSSESVASPIQAVTFSKEASSSRKRSPAGTPSASPRQRAMATISTTPMAPQNARMEKGGTCVSSSFIAGQLTPQPRTVASSSA